MSGEDHTCGHACKNDLDKVRTALARMARRHKSTMESWIAICIGSENAMVGHFNGSILNRSLQTLLREAEDMPPSDCPECDVIRKVAPLLLATWRKAMSDNGIGEKITCN